MFIAALFTIAKARKQPKCPLTAEWIQMTYHMYTMNYYSVMQRNGITPPAEAWMNREVTTLSEVKSREKDKYHVISLIHGI